MTRLTIDTATETRLGEIGEVVELCGASGRVLGRFVPAVDPDVHGPLEPQVSEEELSRREQSNERGFSTHEVAEHLENL